MHFPPFPKFYFLGVDFFGDSPESQSISLDSQRISDAFSGEHFIRQVNAVNTFTFLHILALKSL